MNIKDKDFSLNTQVNSTWYVAWLTVKGEYKHSIQSYGYDLKDMQERVEDLNRSLSTIEKKSGWKYVPVKMTREEVK